MCLIWKTLRVTYVITARVNDAVTNDDTELRLFCSGYYKGDIVEITKNALRMRQSRVQRLGDKEN